MINIRISAKLANANNTEREQEGPREETGRAGGENWGRAEWVRKMDNGGLIRIQIGVLCIYRKIYICNNLNW